MVDKAVDPTCETPGLTEGKHCSVCNEVLVAQEEVKALGHSYNDGIITKQPTTEEVGEITYSCECGDSYTIEIAKLEKEPTEESSKSGCGGREGVIIVSIFGVLALAGIALIFRKKYDK